MKNRWALLLLAVPCLLLLLPLFLSNSERQEKVDGEQRIHDPSRPMPDQGIRSSTARAASSQQRSAPLRPDEEHGTSTAATAQVLGTTLEVTVNSWGYPVDGARIVLQGPGGSEVSEVLTTGNSVLFELVPGEYLVKVDADTLLEPLLPPTIQLAPNGYGPGGVITTVGEGENHLELVLGTSAAVSGVVVDSRGALVPSMLIRFTHVKKAEERFLGWARLPCVDGEFGGFIHPGTWLVEAIPLDSSRRGKEYPEFPKLVEILEGYANYIELHLESGSGVITLQVKDMEGNPFEGLKLVLARSAIASNASRQQETLKNILSQTTSTDGTVHFANLPAGIYRVNCGGYEAYGPYSPATPKIKLGERVPPLTIELAEAEPYTDVIRARRADPLHFRGEIRVDEEWAAREGIEFHGVKGERRPRTQPVVTLTPVGNDGRALTQLNIYVGAEGTFDFHLDRALADGFLTLTFGGEILIYELRNAPDGGDFMIQFPG